MFFDCLNTDFSVSDISRFLDGIFQYIGTIIIPFIIQCLFYFNVVFFYPRQCRSKQLEGCIYAVEHRDL